MNESNESLIDFIARVRSQNDPEATLLEQTLGAASERSPELAEAIRYCGIPRRFDAEIVGVLRGKPAERHRSQELFEQVIEHSFVVRHRAGGYVYHDKMRDLLLNDWRKPQHAGEFKTLNRRLIRFYDGRQAVAAKLDLDLAVVADLIKSISPSRYGEIVGRFEEHRLAPMLEAIYHAALISALDGLEQFETYYFQAEAIGRPQSYKSLIFAAKDCLGRQAEEHLPRKPSVWIRYYEARLSANTAAFREAEALLRELLPEAEEDAKLKLWILGDLGSICRRTGRAVESSRMYEQAVALGEQSSADSWNQPVWLSGVGDANWSLQRFRASKEDFTRALESAKSVQNVYHQAAALLNLSEVGLKLGEPGQALNHAFAALELVRAQRQRVLCQEVVAQFMSLFANSPELVETVYAEANAMIPPSASSETVRFLRRDYAHALRRGGRLNRAEEVLEELAGEGPGGGDAEVLLELALLREDQGRGVEAVEIYDRILRQEGPDGSPWMRTIARYNRGCINREMGRYDEAATDFDCADHDCAGAESDVLNAYFASAKAEMLRLRGHPREAIALSASVDDAMRCGDVSVLAASLWSRAQSYRALWQWAEAQRACEEAHEMYLSAEQLARAARMASEAAFLSSRSGDWEAVQPWAETGAKLWREAAADAAFQPSQAERTADEQNAGGVRFIACSPGPRGADFERARELIRGAAEQMPGNAWYQLNLAFVAATLGEWPQALAALEKALETKPAWRHSETLSNRLKDYRLRVGRAVRRDGTEALVAGDYHAALGFYREALRNLLESTATRGQITDLLSRLAFSAAIAGETKSAKTALVEAILYEARAEAPSPGKDVGEACRKLLPNADAYVRLASLWADCENEIEDPVFAAEIADARLALASYLNTAYGLEVPPQQVKRGVLEKRLIIECGANVCPADRSDPVSLTEIRIPRMRQRIKSEFGIDVPGMEFRRNDIPEWNDTYSVALDGRVLVRRNAAGDSVASMVESLELALRRNLARCLDFREFSALFDEWLRAAPEFAATLGDPAGKVRCWRVAQELLKERVPIHEWRVILEEFAGSDRRSVRDIAGRIRLRLRRALPGMGSHAKRIMIAPELEERFRRCARTSAGETYLAMTAEEIEEAVTRLRELIRDQAGEVVLIAEPEVRPLVASLVMAHFPDVFVLSTEEAEAGTFVKA